MAESDEQPFSETAFNQEWLTPEEALDALRSNYIDPYTRRKYVMGRLQSGLIQAVARTIEFKGEHWQFRGIGHGPFSQCDEYGDDHFWETGDLTFWLGDAAVRAFDIRFDPDSFTGRPTKPKRPVIGDEEQENRKPVTVEADKPQQNRGGRPRNEYWEPLLIEIARQLYSGDLQPKRQADIENAMHDWLTANGHKGGETQVRQRARSIWEAIQK